MDLEFIGMITNGTGELPKENQEEDNEKEENEE